jgi:hypothetical protein
MKNTKVIKKTPTKYANIENLMAENMTKLMFKILKTIPGTNSNNPKITENKQSGHIAHYLSVKICKQ